MYIKGIQKKKVYPMDNFNNIMKMLDWNNSDETQARGRILAESIECLNIFMQPMDKEFNKNVQGNCALILNKKDDFCLQPYLFDLLDWLQDLNWPGAYTIYERLLKFKNHEKIVWAINKKINIATSIKDDIWKQNLISLLENIPNERVKENYQLSFPIRN